MLSRADPAPIIPKKSALFQTTSRVSEKSALFQTTGRPAASALVPTPGRALLMISLTLVSGHQEN